MRTTAFLDVGGFDKKYRYPSVEDIELGMRVAANGGKILLVPELRCKHLKQWTFTSMVVTDVAHRARPWTHLILNTRNMPATLNLDWRNRLSSICSVLLIAFLGAAIVVPGAFWAAVACGLAVAAINLDFYLLCLKKRGIGFAVASFVLHICFFIYSTLTFGAIVLHEILLNPGRSMACPANLLHSPAQGSAKAAATVTGSAIR
jgi:hypothetical protein